MQGLARCLAHTSAQYVIIIDVTGRIDSALSHAVACLREAPGQEDITVPIFIDHISESQQIRE